MLHLGIWISGGPGSAGLIVGLDDLQGHFQPEFSCDSVISLWPVLGASGWLCVAALAISKKQPQLCLLLGSLLKTQPLWGLQQGKAAVPQLYFPSVHLESPGSCRAGAACERRNCGMGQN